MAEPTLFRGVIEFLQKLGVYDVILPFLLIFTIVFAILEKTKVFGTVKIDNVDYTKKNLNSMAAFVIALMAIASVEVVGIINSTMANVVLLLLMVVSFLMLVGSFYREKEAVFLEGGWKTAFMWILFIGIIIIFLNSAGWLEGLLGGVSGAWNPNIIGTGILIVIIIGFIIFITKGEKATGTKPAKKEGE